LRRAEEDVRGAIPEEMLEPIDDVTGASGGEPFEADGRPGNVAGKGLRVRPAASEFTSRPNQIEAIQHRTAHHVGLPP
jgi:hypothetical protein